MNPKLPRNKCKKCEKICSTPVAVFCSNKCQQDFQYEAYIARWKQGLETGNRVPAIGGVSNHVKRYLKIKYKNKCSRCEWNTPHPSDKEPPLEVEHIDGNWENSVEDNLTLLCPNCHALTDTYRGRNKGRGRLLRTKR